MIAIHDDLVYDYPLFRGDLQKNLLHLFRNICVHHIVPVLRAPFQVDLFDLYFLVGISTGINVSLIDKKMRAYSHVFEQERLNKRIDLIKSVWEKELRRLLHKKEHVIMTLQKLLS